MNKKLFALLVVAAVTGQASADWKNTLKKPFKLFNAVANPLDLTGDKTTPAEQAKYVVVKTTVANVGELPVVKDENGDAGYIGVDNQFHALTQYDFGNGNGAVNDAVAMNQKFADDFAVVRDVVNNRDHYVVKNGNDPVVHDNGTNIVTKASTTDSIEKQGRDALNAFWAANDANKTSAAAAAAAVADNKANNANAPVPAVNPAGNLSDAIWAVRHAVVGKKTSSALILAGWVAAVGTPVATWFTAKNSDDEEDEEEVDENA